tara:strand:- start:1236 stop:1943 length:708 start_codon:yes stop_codon:yes gene_type:complete
VYNISTLRLFFSPPLSEGKNDWYSYVAPTSSLFLITFIFLGTWISVEKAVSSLAFSPTGSYLATAHVDDIGIYLWANRAFFSRVFLQPLSLEKPVGTVALPLVQVAEGTGEEEHESEEEGSDVDLDEKERRKQAKEAREWEEKKLKKSNVVTFSESDTLLVTLSGLSSNHWKDLPMLDLIRQRNKPTEPTKPKESAPFFLDMKLGKTQNTILSSTDAAAPVKTGEHNLARHMPIE